MIYCLIKINDLTIIKFTIADEVENKPEKSLELTDSLSTVNTNK